MTVVVDAHVHVHPGWERDRLLDAAWRNVDAAAGDGSPVTGVLLLAEMDGRDTYARWSAEAGEGAGKGWHLRRTEEAAALIARRADGATLVLVAGRQVRTREGLEVLVQGTTARVPDGAPFDETVARARGRAPLVTVPWALGKWWGSRGRTVARLIGSAEGADVLLADNGLRPRLSVLPPLIRAARADGRPVLAGSDPLPLPGHLERVGSYGVILAGPLVLGRPTECLVDQLRSGPAPRRYGVGRPLAAFLAEQLRIRMGARGSRP